MTRKDERIDLEPEAPRLLKQIKWFEIHGRKNWKIVIVAILILSGIPIYKGMKEYLTASKPLGIFNITFSNQLSEPLRINNPGEFYIHAPATPGTNKQISSALIGLEFPPNTYVLQIEPSTSVTLRAELANEARQLQYLDAEEFFGLIIFSASPKRIQHEILLKRETFKNGIKIIIDEKKEGHTNIQ